MINEMMGLVEGKNILHKAFALQDAIEDLPEDERITKEDLEPLHYFADGMYLRSLFLPEGVAVVGEMHRHSHFTILAEGTSTIANVATLCDSLYSLPCQLSHAEITQMMTGIQTFLRQSAEVEAGQWSVYRVFH